MTTARQERKSRPWRAILPAIAVAMAVSTGFAIHPCRISAATTELIVINPQTGLAIDGFDPVAYFVDGAPKVGIADFEVRFAGASWRFRIPGNRAAFMAYPQVYMPRFGGYDPIAIARGAGAAGHPRLWLIVHERLYLFHSAAARAEFAADPDRAIEAAERHWPEVKLTLSP